MSEVLVVIEESDKTVRCIYFVNSWLSAN